MKKAIFITVRTGSSRLPQKALMKIAGKPTIEHLIERIKHSQKKDIVVLCTTELKEDDVLVQIAQKNEIGIYRGSVKDKLERWRGAAHTFEVDFFVTADGDDLFCEPELIDLAFSQYEKTDADFIEGKDIICGAFTYGIKTMALEKVCEIKDTDDTEMMWVYFTQTGLFKTETLHNIPLVFKRPEIRMTLDYEEDFRFFHTIIEQFIKVKSYYSLRDILTFLDSHPDVVKINQHLQQQFLSNQKAKTKLILKKTFTKDA